MRDTRENVVRAALIDPVIKCTIHPMEIKHHQPVVEAYTRYWAVIAKFLRKELHGRMAEAEDLAQEVFVRYSRVLSREAVQNPKALLFRMARNLLIDSGRAEQKRQNCVKDILSLRADAQADQGVSPEEEMLVKEALAVIEAVVRNLPPKCRRAFVLSRYHNLTHSEISADMGISIAGVKRHINLALAKCDAAIKGLDKGRKDD